MIIANSIHKCSSSKHPARDGDPTGIAIHRFGVDGVHDAQSLALWSRGEASVGGKMPYSYVYGRDGVLEQALPDHRWGWHCRAKSKVYIAIALIGDFRRTPLDARREAGLVELCAILAVRYHFDETKVYGHTEIPDGTAWKNHECPGSMINMDKIRQQISAKIREEKLRQIGG